MRGWPRALLLDGVIVVAWLLSVGMVLVHERGQLLGGLSNPTATLSATIEAKEQWFGLYYQGQKIGFSKTALTPLERGGVPGVGITDYGRIFFSLLGSPQQLEVDAQAFIDADWRLQTFSASIKSATYNLKWTGRRHGDELLVTVEAPGSAFTKRLTDPTGSAFVNGLSSWAAFHRLRVGQSGKAWVLNPLALNPEAVYFSVPRREMLDGREALVVETDVGGMATTSWVTPEGEVLKEVSPLGWELRQESMAQALKGLSAQAPTTDLLAATSVPVDQPLENPEGIAQLVLLVEGERSMIQTPWQTILPSERLAEYQRAPPQGAWCLIQLRRPTLSEATPAVPETVKRYQRPSPFVQSDDPRLIAKAKEVVGGETDPWKQVALLNHWVFSTVTKRLTIGLPSAVDVLITPVGDCHEHTVFFTALARSLGIPTRMIAGLVYQHGRLFYHAWPEVWVGEWIPIDPTLGQPLADVTHLGLIEAENENLIALGQFVGKLRVHVLSVVR